MIRRSSKSVLIMEFFMNGQQSNLSFINRLQCPDLPFINRHQCPVLAFINRRQCPDCYHTRQTPIMCTGVYCSFPSLCAHFTHVFKNAKEKLRRDSRRANGFALRIHAHFTHIPPTSITAKMGSKMCVTCVVCV